MTGIIWIRPSQVTSAEDLSQYEPGCWTGRNPPPPPSRPAHRNVQVLQVANQIFYVFWFRQIKAYAKLSRQLEDMMKFILHSVYACV